ncbi:YqjK family protein [Tepidicella baoligensis]|uniref:YqjK family protein n=1 Tax=Tepidicella baoligensis TaxID=2707016 RepID=UPI0015DB222F|nr:YqjK family protein [Tepidicella baoligensis]
MRQRQALWMRRAELVQRSGLLRERLVAHGRALQPLFQVADQARHTAHWMRAHPWVPLGVVGLLVWRRPRRWWRWAWKGWAAWRLYVRVRRAWQGGRV